MVSQALLNRFASPDGFITAYDLRYGVSNLRTSKAVGFESNFVKREPDTTEAVWREVEELIRPALSEVDQQSGPLSETTERVVKDLVALHFARSLATSAGHSRALVHAEEKVRSNKADLARLARAKYSGLHLDFAPSIHAEIADEIIAAVRDEESTGTVFRDDVLRYFEVTRTNLSTFSLMVRPLMGEAELLLGDCPAVSLSRGMEPSTRSPLLEAAFIAMPLGPQNVAFVYPDGIDEPVVPVGPEEALYLNRSQVAQAQRQVYSRPGSGLNQMVQAYRQPSRRQ